MYGYWFDSQIWKFNKHYMAIEPIRNGLVSDDLFDITSVYNNAISLNPVITDSIYDIEYDYILLVDPIISSNRYEISCDFDTYVPIHYPYVISDNRFYINSLFDTYVKTDAFICSSNIFTISSNYNIKE